MSDLKVLARSRDALSDEFLQAAVRFTADRLRGKKKVSTEALGRWEEWRDRGQAIRAHTVSHLDFYLKQFADNARQAGANVHFAATGDEAISAVMHIAQEKQAKSVVKAKSMVSEEIHLNHHLQDAGIDVVETDLGEYIVQLAKETPSHIIIPAIHKNREQIRELFTEDGGKDLSTDTKVLAGFARRRLREKFLNADIGVTGCNFGIAESGSICLFTNEGNADMVTNLPKTHIVLMGMERLLPTFADLEVMANLLPRSATGQKLTTYMSVITGSKRSGDSDGAEEVHIIILDNGRSRQLGDPDFHEILHCIRCGACLNVCPVYRHVGGHSYGSVYPGPIGAVLSPLLAKGRQEQARLEERGGVSTASGEQRGATPTMEDDYSDLPYASSLCGACYEACPVKIPLHDMLVKLRQKKVASGQTSGTERAMFRGFRIAFASPGRYRLSMGVGRAMQGPLVRDGYITTTFGPLAGWTSSRYAPSLAKTSFRDGWAALQHSLGDVSKEDGE